MDKEYISGADKGIKKTETLTNVFFLIFFIVGWIFGKYLVSVALMGAIIAFSLIIFKVI